MTAGWLLQGKTLPPKRLAAVQSRALLLDRLAKEGVGRVVVVEAPAGFGKTTLLALWRARLLSEAQAVGWLTLDAGDIGGTLAAYLALALSEAGIDMTPAGFFGGGLGPGSRATVDIDAVLGAAAAHDGDIHLILDEVEKVADPEALAILNRLLRFAPDNLHVVFAFRSNPGLELATASLNGLIFHVDAESLRFTSAETAAYLDGVIAPGEVRAADARADGWPVALQLIRSLAEKGKDVTLRLGDAEPLMRYTAAYIAEQLFRGLSPDQRQLLLDASLLDPINLSLLDHVREANDAAATLEELDYLSALITPLDGEPRLLRMHPLLKEQCSEMAARDGARFSRIHQRAAGWLVAHEQLLPALRHASAIHDTHLIGRLIERAGAVAIWIRNGMGEITAADRLVDDQMVRAYPRLGLMRAIVLIKQAKIREARVRYEFVDRITENFTRDREGGDLTALRRDGLFVRSMLALYGCMTQLHGDLAALDRELNDPSADHIVLAHHKTVLCVTSLQAGRFDVARARAREAAEHCHACGSVFGAIFLEFHAGSVAMARGDGHEAEHRYEKGRRTARRQFPQDVGLRVIGDVLVSELDLERNRLAEVRRRVPQILDRLHGTEAWYDIYAAAYGTVSEAELIGQGIGDALALLDRADAHAEHQGLDKLHRLIDALRAGALALASDAGQAMHILTHRLPTVADLLADNAVSWREAEAVAIAWARTLARAGRHDEADAAIAAALAYARDIGALRTELRLLVLQALNAELSGRGREASRILSDALGIVMRTGYARAFLREGPELLPILASLSPEAEPERKWVRDIAALLTGEGVSRNAVPVFSPREIDVLRHLKTGLQDKMIARRLGVSEHAVRFHLKNIYAKTQARGRLEAVAKARAMGVAD